MKLFVFTLLIISLFSCEGDYYINYHWENMVAHNADNSAKWPEITMQDSIASEVFAINLELEAVETYKEGRYLDPETPPANTNPITDLRIYSSADFNSTYVAGVNLVDHFIILRDNYTMTIPANGSEGYDIPSTLSYQFNDKPMVDHIDLLLTGTPENITFHTFTVVLTLRDGTEFTSTTNPIKLY